MMIDSKRVIATNRRRRTRESEPLTPAQLKDAIIEAGPLAQSSDASRRAFGELLARLERRIGKVCCSKWCREKLPTNLLSETYADPSD